MRVERFALFFPPLIWRKKGKGETEYALGAMPLGGYVKISGMSPYEELPPEVEHRAYFRQKPWKRIVVILAGPAGQHRPGLPDPRRPDPAQRRRHRRRQGREGRARPARGGRPRPRRRDRRAWTAAAGTATRCRRGSRPTAARASRRAGCEAASPVTLTIERDGRRVTERVRPGLRPEGQEDAHRLPAARSRRAAPASATPSAARWTRCGSSPRRRSTASPASSTPRSARTCTGVVGLLRDRAQRLLARRPDRAVRARADLAVAGHRQPVPVPAPRRRPRLLGGRGEAPRQGDPVQRDGEVRA